MPLGLRADTLRFELRNGRKTTWSVSVDKGDLSVSHAARKADCIVRADKEEPVDNGPKQQKAEPELKPSEALKPKSLDLAKTLGLSQHLIVVQLNLGVVYCKLRRFEDAISACDAAAAGAERLGDQIGLTRAQRAKVGGGNAARLLKLN